MMEAFGLVSGGSAGRNPRRPRAVAFPVSTHAPTLHPFVVERFSPTRFQPDHRITPAEITTLIEAARRAPSAGNSQPWSFLVAARGDAVHRRMVGHLARSSGTWAPQASLLVANLVQRRIEDSDFEYSEFAHYDLGQAVAHLTVQAHELGLQVHQFRAFDRDGLHREFAVPDHWEIATLAAVGLPAHAPTETTGTSTSRSRRELHEVLWAVSDVAAP
ncbi:putative nitroreductase [Nocardia asteroides NBRC 15531]|uniref:Nitroreductase n=1 Tax=Nocardia asteroides NBRC 15531 TaxID=1110697 RepID=U5EHV1_NOCAS|nr:putative nitroreductase [Nocardia asteroides NBRC 15531]SFM31922.1 Nitroreductase [Nocardia asteroides]VEG35896.1 dihydropteridine reductase [Nocardia asteroides]